MALHDRHNDTSAAAADAQYARMIAEKFTRLNVAQGAAENEFREGAAALSRAFPLVFPLGAERAFTKPGPPGAAQIRHMLLQFTCAAAHQRDLVFYFQDMMRRHAIVRSVVATVRTGMLQSFHDTVNSDRFKSLTEQARGSGPDAEAAEASVQSTLQPFVRTVASAVPNGPAVRRKAVNRIHALSYYLGLPSTWLTMSYDCVQSATAIQMSFPTVNDAFPLSAFLDAYADGSSTFSHGSHAIDLTSPGLNKLCGENPVAAAEVFAAKTAVILEELLGLQDESKHKKTRPAWRRVGIFSTPFGFYMVVEAQGRGALHWHLLYWGRYSPQLLLAASTSRTFKEAIQAAFSTMTHTELPRELHLQKLAQRAQCAQGVPVTQPLERPARRPRDVSGDADCILKRARCCNGLEPRHCLEILTRTMQVDRDQLQCAHALPNVSQGENRRM